MARLANGWTPSQESAPGILPFLLCGRGALQSSQTVGGQVTEEGGQGIRGFTFCRHKGRIRGEKIPLKVTANRTFPHHHKMYQYFGTPLGNPTPDRNPTPRQYHGRVKNTRSTPFKTFWSAEQYLGVETKTGGVRLFHPANLSICTSICSSRFFWFFVLNTCKCWVKIMPMSVSDVGGFFICVGCCLIVEIHGMQMMGGILRCFSFVDSGIPLISCR